MTTKSPTVSLRRRSLLRSILLSMLLAIIVTGFIWYIERLGASLTIYDYLGLPAVILLFGLLQWRSHGRLQAGQGGSVNTPRQTLSAREKQPAEDPRAAAAERARQAGREKRLFIHLVSVLQREGRLMDFFQEDLSTYEDGQIGAAVRSIHESCRKTLANYLDLEPVLAQREGETVDVSADFDPTAIKLVGNVVGEPPFSGVLRHPGWQLRGFKLPELSDVPRADIIAPAEVEVM